MSLQQFSSTALRRLLVAAAVVLFSGIHAQTTGTVYFVGIGIENCKVADVPQKALAKNDVNAVLAKTKTDLETKRISYFSSGLNKQIKYSDVVSTCLFDEFATIESIEQLFTEIAAKANAYDLFYFYVNAPCDQNTGGFFLPCRPLKKGEKVPPQEMLDPLRLHELFAKIPCRNQVIIVDDASWKISHEKFSAQFFQGQEKQKNQVLIVPAMYTPDTFSIAGNKQVGMLAAIISRSQSSMLYVFDETGVDDVSEELVFTAYDLTKKRQKIATFYSSASSSSAGVLVDKPVEKPKTIVQTDTPPPAFNAQSGDAKPASRAAVKPDNKKQIADSIVGSVRNYALIIGVSDYKDSAWPDLPNPVFDGQALNDELKNHYGFETNFLVNPTKAKLFRALDSLSSMNFDEHSQVLVFFAGHGGMNRFDGYIVPSDGKNPASDPEMNSFIPYGMLWKMVKAIPSRHVLVMLDACYSGTFDGEELAINRSANEEKKNDIDHLKLISETMKYGFKGYLTSGGKETVSDGKPGEHSPFMNIILDCLKKGYSKSEVVLFTELAAKVKAVTKPVPRWGILNMEPGGDFLFIPQKR
ncbi:MAG: caspase family protein [Bacteroidia bacterium]